MEIINANRWLKLLLYSWPILMLAGLTGCTSNAAPAHAVDSPAGIAYFHIENNGPADTGMFYFHDFKSGETRRLSDQNQFAYLYTRSIDWSPQTGQFVYGTGILQETEIFTVDVSGQKHQRLTSNNYDDIQAYWSPNGDRIAFLSRDSDEKERAYIMNADGAGKHKLLKNNEIIGGGIMRWSPDGRRIAMYAHGTLPSQLPSNSTNQADVTNLYIVDVDTGEIEYSIVDGLVHKNTTWAPDQRQLAFTASLPDRGLLYIWDLSTNQPKLIVDEPGDLINVHWSPDGRWLAISAGVLSKKVEVYIVHPDGTDLTSLTSDILYAASDGETVWSADSRCLVFSGATGLQNNRLPLTVYVANIETKARIQVTNEPDYNLSGTWVSSRDASISCESQVQIQQSP